MEGFDKISNLLQGYMDIWNRNHRLPLVYRITSLLVEHYTQFYLHPIDDRRVWVRKWERDISRMERMIALLAKVVSFSIIRINLAVVLILEICSGKGDMLFPWIQEIKNVSFVVFGNNIEIIPRFQTPYNQWSCLIHRRWYTQLHILCGRRSNIIVPRENGRWEEINKPNDIWMLLLL